MLLLEGRPSSSKDKCLQMKPISVWVDFTRAASRAWSRSQLAGSLDFPWTGPSSPSPLLDILAPLWSAPSTRQHRVTRFLSKILIQPLFHLCWKKVEGQLSGEYMEVWRIIFPLWMKCKSTSVLSNADQPWPLTSKAKHSKQNCDLEKKKKLFDTSLVLIFQNKLSS